MMTNSRLWRAAALGLLGIGLWSGALAAQNDSTIGNPQLKDFQLPGQRTTPPPPEPQPAPAPARTAPSAARTALPTATTPAVRTPAQRPPAERSASAPAAPSTRRAPPAAAPVQTAVPAAPVPAPAPAPIAAAPQPLPPAAAPVPAPQPAAPAPAPPPASGFGLNWLWLAVPLLLGLLGFVLLRRRRASVDEEDPGVRGALLPFERPTPAPVAEPLPERTSPPPSAPEPGIPAPVAEADGARPWLELDIEPDRAASTASEASLNYVLVLTNVGDAPARNIRIGSRMFNAADEQEIGDFLGTRLHRHSGSPHVSIPPGQNLRLPGEIAMKAEDVRAIELQGRSIFVPTVAVNVAYDWGDSGEGRSSKSWLLGRKSDNPDARMGAFRLDLGPRIYRSVGRKDTKKVMV